MWDCSVARRAAEGAPYGAVSAHHCDYGAALARVAVRDGHVYKRDFAMATGREEGRLLRQQEGVQGTAFIVFADGSLHEKRITDDASLVRAQADAVRFTPWRPQPTIRQRRAP